MVQEKSASVAALEEPEFWYTIFSDTSTGVIIPSQALFWQICPGALSWPDDLEWCLLDNAEWFYYIFTPGGLMKPIDKYVFDPW